MPNNVSSGSARVSSNQSASANAKYLELDGLLAGVLMSAHGGQPTSDVVSEKLGPDHVVRKHIAGVNYSDIIMEAGFGLDVAFYTWLEASLAHNYQRKDGALITTDFDGKPVSRVNFYNALIMEVAFPELDVNAKEPGHLTVKIAPEYTRGDEKLGSLIAGAVRQEPPKVFHPRNFKLVIDKLDCTRVSKIDALVVKQHITENPTGELRTYEREPTHLEIPDLVVTFANRHGEESWSKWFKDFIIDGNNGQDNERSGDLVFLNERLDKELCTISLIGLGIYSYTGPEYCAGIDPEEKNEIKAKLYCEEMKVKFPKHK
jgi:phage tail-like protein